MPRKKLISVIVPVFNEEENVERAYQAVRNTFENILNNEYRFEIIFTDNHSTDNTFQELTQIADLDSRVRVARFTRNFGFNKSLLTAYLLAKGDAAIQVDCDLQDPPELFPRFIEFWEAGHDVVIGLRKTRPEPVWLLEARKLFYRLLASISEDNLMIDGGDFRLVDRHILDSLKEIQVAAPYVRGLVSIFAKNQTGFPYERRQRQYGQSKFPLLKLFSMGIDGIVSHTTLPLRIASLLGMSLAVFTLLLMLVYVTGKLFFGMDWPDGFTTTVILVLFGIAVNAVFLGIIGEYLSRIYQQLRGHPLTVIEKGLNLEESRLAV
ncbi:MAG TPA: glycosyltransferase family 2 protein [Coleofasciculaceae cyanobacterium]